jgi:hypothetical protein
MQMTAVATPAGAPLTGPVDWKQVNRNVKRLQVRIVKAIEFVLLLRPAKGRL